MTVCSMSIHDNGCCDGGKGWNRDQDRSNVCGSECRVVSTLSRASGILAPAGSEPSRSRSKITNRKRMRSRSKIKSRIRRRTVPAMRARRVAKTLRIRDLRFQTGGGRVAGARDRNRGRDGGVVAPHAVFAGGALPYRVAAKRGKAVTHSRWPGPHRCGGRRAWETRRRPGRWRGRRPLSRRSSRRARPAAGRSRRP